MKELGGKPEITRFKGLGEISPKEFAQFIGKQMRLSKVEYAPRTRVRAHLQFLHGQKHARAQRLHHGQPRRAGGRLKPFSISPMPAKRKKDSNQPELPIEGAKPESAEAKPAKKKSTRADGNGAEHVVAETVEAIVHRAVRPEKTGQRPAHARGPRFSGLRELCHPRPRHSESRGRPEAGAAAHSICALHDTG
jgi:hypothetical protein